MLRSSFSTTKCTLVPEYALDGKPTGELVLRPNDWNAGIDRFVCCVCEDSRWLAVQCSNGLWNGHGVTLDNTFYVLPFHHDHKICRELFTLNPLVYEKKYGSADSL